MMSPWGLAILGVVLLVLGLIFGVGLLWIIGLVCLVIGLAWGVATGIGRGPRTPV